MRGLLKSALWSVFVGLLAGAGSASAADSYRLDSDRSHIQFTVQHHGFSIFEGEFQDFMGGFVFDWDDPSRSKIEVTIKTASVDTNQSLVDNQLRSRDFLHVSVFPEITFKSREVRVIGTQAGLIVGDLTVRGVTRPVALDVTLKEEVSRIKGYRETARFTALGRVKRSDFGMDEAWPGFGDDIEIRIDLAAERH